MSTPNGLSSQANEGSHEDYERMLHDLDVAVMKSGVAAVQRALLLAPLLTRVKDRSMHALEVACAAEMGGFGGTLLIEMPVRDTDFTGSTT